MLSSADYFSGKKQLRRFFKKLSKKSALVAIFKRRLGFNFPEIQ